MTDYVFGYASLVALEDVGALPGRLRGYRRHWGVAMNNWEGGEGVKHWLDPTTGERPRIRVAYLDIEPTDGMTVNGVVIPVDGERMAQLDAREINYRRVDLTVNFEGPAHGRVFAYVGLDAARKRCRQGAVEGNAFVSRDYFAGVRRAFQSLGNEGIVEFDRTTDRLPFPERDLKAVYPSSATGS